MTRQVSPNLVRIVFLAVVILWVIYLLRIVLLPFVAAGAVTCIAEPLVRWICSRWRCPRWASATLVFLLVLAILSLLGYYVATYGVPELQIVLAQLPEELRALLHHLFGGHDLQIFGTTLRADDVSEHMVSSLQNYVDPRSALRVSSIAIGALMGAFLTLVLILFFLLQGPRLAAGALWMIPPLYRSAAARFGRRCLPILWRYIAGVMLVVAYASALTWIVARLILNIPHAGLFAIAVGLLELIPVVGPILSAILIGAMALSRGGVGEILGFAGFALGLRLSIDQLVGPIVLGRAVSVPAPIIIFTMLVGGALWGILGVLLAVPTAAMVRLALEMAYDESPPEPPTPPDNESTIPPPIS